MRRFVFLFVLAATLAVAQGAPKPAASDRQMQIQVARDKLAIAQLTQQVHELQAKVALYERYMGLTDQLSTDRKAVDDATAELQKLLQPASAKK